METLCFLTIEWELIIGTACTFYTATFLITGNPTQIFTGIKYKTNAYLGKK